MDRITNFQWTLGSTKIEWHLADRDVILQYKQPVRSAVLLDDSTGVAVVESFDEVGRDNAVVFNADGSIRFRLQFPLPEPFGNCFDQMYYIGGKLTAFANVRDADFGYELDQENGAVVRTFESR